MYQRFLNNNDYLAIITEDLFDQVIHGNQDRIVHAEQSAEMSIKEYLENYYEIDEELAKGKCIREYDPMVNYPPNVHFVKENVIYKTLQAINGYKKPTTKVYWEQLCNFKDMKELERVKPYFQTRTYLPNDVVRYGTEYWICKIGNGADFKNIRIPGLTAWEKVDFEEWVEMYDYALHSVVSYKEKFYALISKTEEHDVSLTPAQSDDWGLIGDYTTDYEYDFSDEAYDYVVCDGSVFKPIINPNSDTLVEGENIAVDEPRNLNIVKHMTRIALYYLHQTISPTNISETRRLMYEDSMNWLALASKFKINPGIKRKKDEKGQDKVDWAFADYHKDFDVNDNEWII